MAEQPGTDGPTHLPAKRLTIIGGLQMLVWLIHVALDYVDELGEGPLATAIFFIGILSFYGWRSSGFGMRTTITATFVSIYLALVAAFLTSAEERSGLMTEAGDEVWQRFTWLVGVIVISYFGASVASEAITRINPGAAIRSALSDDSPTSSQAADAAPEATAT